MRRLPLCVLAISLLAAVRPAAAQTLIGTVPIGNGASFVNVNSATNKIYVTNFYRWHT